MDPNDPFDDVFNLEDKFYQEGFDEGRADGLERGRLEGRAMGLEKGYEKFLQSGRLRGRAIIWKCRVVGPPYPADLPDDQVPTAPQSDTASGSEGPSTIKEGKESEGESGSLPPLPAGGRLEKNVDAILELLDPHTLPKANTDEDIADFDERFRQAEARAKVVERLAGEDTKGAVRAPKPVDLTGATIEDLGMVKRPRTGGHQHQPKKRDPKSNPLEI